MDGRARRVDETEVVIVGPGIAMEPVLDATHTGRNSIQQNSSAV